MSATMDIIVSAQDQASDVIEGIGETAEETGSWIDNNWGKVTAATAAAGAASEGFARSQADTNATLGRMAHRTGESEESLRGMIDGMTDATFSSHDAAAGMEALSARGIESKEDFEALLPTFDDFSDATGKDMVQGIEEVSRVLGAFNIPVEEAGDHIDTMTHMSENLGIPLDRLGRQLGNNSDELAEMNIGVDESAALLQALRDRGMDGRDAMKMFTEQVKEADGDQDALLEGLGLTADEFEEYQGKVADAEGVTGEFADINNSTMTPLERMQANVENLMMKYGGLADAAGMAAPALMAMGPAMKGVSMATRGLSGAMSFLAANPIVLVIAVVAALAAGLVYLWRNSETFRDIVMGVFDAVGGAATWLWENAIQPAWEGIQAGFSWLGDAAAAFGEWWSSTIERAGEIATWLWESVLEIVFDAVRTGLGWVVDAALAYRDAWLAVFEAAAAVAVWLWENVLEPTWEYIKAGFEILGQVAGVYRDAWVAVFERVADIVVWAWENVISPAWDALVGGLEWVGDKAGELRDLWGDAMQGVQDGARAIVNPIIGFFNSIIGGVESLINAIAGGVNSIPSIRIPDIPGVPGRGETISLPSVPTVSFGRIPQLADGGIVRARPGGILAQIGEGGQDEAVTPLGPNDPFGKLLDELRALRQAVEAGQVLAVDGETLARIGRRHGNRRAARTLEVRTA